MTEAGTSPSSPRKDLIQRDQCIFTSTTHIAGLSAARKKKTVLIFFVEFDAFCQQKKQHFNFLLLLQFSTLGKSINFTNSTNLTSFKCRFNVVFVENQDDLNLFTNPDTCYIPSQTQGKLIC